MKIRTLMTVHQRLAAGECPNTIADDLGIARPTVWAIANEREYAARVLADEAAEDAESERRAWNRERAASVRSAL